MEHTPAPWTRDTQSEWTDDDRKRGYVTLPIFDTDDLCVAEVHIAAPGNEQGEAPEVGQANAHLIAAAPEMLDALKDALDVIQSHENRNGFKGEYMDSRIADISLQGNLARVIAKAEGR